MPRLSRLLPESLCTWVGPGRLGGLFLVLAGLLSSCAQHKIHQLYYLGVFDPTEQLPPTIYRVRVRGQSASVSTVNFAAGWVPAPFVDSLETSIGFDADTGEVTLAERDPGDPAGFDTGRRLMLFGPEGFREAPPDHRLVVLMSSDPSEFFSAIDDALGQLSAAKTLEATDSAAVESRILEEVLETSRRKTAIDGIGTSVLAEAGQ